ncbi:hypothetical protein NM208_g7113 [Fusarium decemcellulare]|uniref:Uncharacterized protein n=1 Tax=Fusarium decemcellulare TaxID=57161 RepID=A0ACC1SAK0_9HYPO|nr:hypothetical protein NM208_g7113 [Fusarium decemcellulare]
MVAHARGYRESGVADVESPSPGVHLTPSAHSNEAHIPAPLLQSPGFSDHVSGSPSDTSSILRSHWLSAFAAEAIVSRLLDDWFDKIHPLAPILLRRRFFRRLHNREADLDPMFCGLVISVCAATKATLPRRDYGPVTVEHCIQFLDTHGLLRSRFAQGCFSLDWCIAMYNMGMAMNAVSESGLSNMRSYHALNEAATGARYLAYYCMHELDEAERQLLRRLFWLLFAASCSADIFGRLSVSLMAQDRIENFPRPQPLSDDQMEPQHESECRESTWHGDDTSYVPGLNSLSDLFLIWQEVQQIPKGNETPSMVGELLDKIQRVIDNLPPELRWRGGLSRPPNVTQGHDVQIANLFITSLDIKSNILQRFGPAEASALEHQKIVDDLLEILYHLPQAVFDANGSSLVPKIRDIGAAYLEQTQLRDGATSTVAAEVARNKLERLLRKLDDLDCWLGLGVVDSPPLRR